MEGSTQPICLTIAGLDPSGGAGIIADIKTFSAFGCFPTAVISSITFQNTAGVFGVVHQTGESVRGQLKPILEDFQIAAVKTGMLPTAESIEVAARSIEEFSLQNVVIDPVVRSTSGFDLIDDAALNILIEELFPLSTLITPNLPEAERIARKKIETDHDIETAARIMRDMGAAKVLIKGGHFYDRIEKSDGRKARDFLFIGADLTILESDLIETTATHGTGCTLSAAIAASLALGKDLVSAVRAAKEFVTEAIRTAPNIGHGHSPIGIPRKR